MEAFLVVVRGALPKRLPLRLPMVIGRSAEAGVKLKAAAVSRQHCRIYEYEQELAVQDLGSSNGTFVNDERIDCPTFLSPGDELRVGGVTFCAEYRLPPGHPGAEDPATDAPSGSRLELRETEGGSFLAIDEPDATAAPASSELDRFLQGLNDQ